jgi:hypothetical protein
MHLLKQFLFVALATLALVPPGRCASPEADVKKVVETFYQNYYHDILLKPEKDTGDGYIKWVKASPVTSPGFKKALEKAVSSARKKDPELGLDLDPIVDGQDYPKKGYRAKTIKIQNNQASVIMQGIGPDDFHISVGLISANGQWLIDRIGNISGSAK